MATQFSIPNDAVSFRLSIGLTGVTYIHFLDSEGVLIDPAVYLLREKTPVHTPPLKPGLRTFFMPSPQTISEFIIDSTLESLKVAGLKRTPDIHFGVEAA